MKKWVVMYLTLLPGSSKNILKILPPLLILVFRLEFSMTDDNPACHAVVYPLWPPHSYAETEVNQ